jgi:chemotaxis protein MotB
MADEKNITVIRKKKIVKGHGGHHGGAWKVAYADFVTAMMAFFMVMWLMGSDEETKAAVAAYFQDKPMSKEGMSASGNFAGGDASNKVTGSQGRFEEKTLNQPSYATPVNLEEYAILKDLSTYYEGSAFTTDIEGDSVKYNLNPRLKFEVGEVSVPNNVESRTLMLRLIDVFKQHDGTVIIEGYADQEQDWALAFGRAMGVKRLLEASGVTPDKLIPIAGYGKRDDDGRVIQTDLKDAATVRFILKRNRNKK